VQWGLSLNCCYLQHTVEQIDFHVTIKTLSQIKRKNLTEIDASVLSLLLTFHDFGVLNLHVKADGTRSDKDKWVLSSYSGWTMSKRKLDDHIEVSKILIEDVLCQNPPINLVNQSSGTTMHSFFTNVQNWVA